MCLVGQNTWEKPLADYFLNWCNLSVGNKVFARSYRSAVHLQCVVMLGLRKKITKYIHVLIFIIEIPYPTFVKLDIQTQFIIYV